MIVVSVVSTVVAVGVVVSTAVAVGVVVTIEDFVDVVVKEVVVVVDVVVLNVGTLVVAKVWVGGVVSVEFRSVVPMLDERLEDEEKVVVDVPMVVGVDAVVVTLAIDVDVAVVVNLTPHADCTSSYSQYPSARHSLASTANVHGSASNTPRHTKCASSKRQRGDGHASLLTYSPHGTSVPFK